MARESNPQQEANGKSEPLPKWSPPKTGILSLLPSSWVPYGELARIHRPTGIFLIYFPHLFGSLFVACSTKHGVVSPAFLLRQNALLLLFSAMLRSAICSWNDTLDREIDAQVERTRLRPLPRGAVTPTQAHIYTIILTSLSFACLYALPETTWVVSVPYLLFNWIYPFAKRFTDFPQVVLGIMIALAFPVGLSATDPTSWEEDVSRFVVSWDHLQYSHWASVLNALSRDRRALGMTAFFIANACWPVVYDTVYAQMDAKDDAKAGVGSVAVRFRGRIKTLLSVVSVVIVSSLLASGHCMGFGQGYAAVAGGGTAAALSYMIGSVDLSKASECSWFIESGSWLVHSTIAGGLLVEYLGLP